jgi:hypothetical protein
VEKGQSPRAQTYINEVHLPREGSIKTVLLPLGGGI